MDEQQLQRTIDELNQTLSSLNGNFQLITAAMLAMGKSVNNSPQFIKKFDDELNKVTGTTKNLTEVQKAQAEAVRQAAKAEEEAAKKAELMSNAMKSAGAALGSFAKGLLDSNVKLSNYSDALSAAGDTALAVGKNFGLLGTVVGGVVKGIMELGAANLKMKQAYFDARTELNKMGGAGTFTTEGLRKLANEAGLTAETVTRATKPIKEIGSNIMVLGGSAGAAQKSFMGLIAFTDKQRMEFQRLGLSQEDMIKGTADYIALQGKAGINIRNQAKDQVALREAALKYQTNLLELSALTGESTDKLKDEQAEALRNRNFMVSQMQLQDKANKARARGDENAAKAIEQEIQNRKDSVAALAHVSPLLRDAATEMAATGNLSSKTAQAIETMGMGEELRKFVANMGKAGDKTQEMADLNKTFQTKYIENIGLVGEAVKNNPEFADYLGATADNMEKLAQVADPKELADLRKKQAEAQKEGTDKTADAMATAQETNIKASLSMENLISKVDPLSPAFKALTLAVVAATASLGVMSAANTFKSLKGAKDIASGAKNIFKSGSGFLKSMGPSASKGARALSGAKLAAPLAIAGAAYEGYSDYQEVKRKEAAGEITAAEAKKEKGQAVGGAAGSAAAGIAGAAIGQALIPIPVVGAAIGGMVGSWLGKKAGSWLGGKATGGSEATTAPAAVAKKAHDDITKAQATLTDSTKQLSQKTLPDLNAGAKSLDQAFKQLATSVKGANSSTTPTAPTASSLMSTVTGLANQTSAMMGNVTAPTKAAPATAAPAIAAPAQASKTTKTANVAGMKALPLAPTIDTPKDSGAEATKTSSTTSKAPPVVAKNKGGGGSMSEDDVKKMIMRHEGKRNKPYKDSLGLWTVGVGHLIGDGKSLPDSWNRTFSDEEVNKLYDEDFQHHKKLAQSNVPGFSKYDTKGQGAFIDLTFNMGGAWPNKFKNTSKAIAAGDTAGAAAGLEDSKWFKQVGVRGPEVTGMIRNANVQAEKGGIAMGPKSGYPATLHGSEMIVPLDPNSILADLGKKTKQQVETEMKKVSEKPTVTNADTGMKDAMIANKELMAMLSTKLDKVIDHLSDSNVKQGKLLRQAMV